VRRATLLAALVVVAGCGGDDTNDGAEPAPPPTATTPATTAEQPPAATVVDGETELAVYFLRDGKIAAARRAVPRTQAVARAALEALAEGPTADERAAGLETDVPAATAVEDLTVANGTATVTLAPCPPMDQVVFTLTQFSTVRRVTGPCLDGVTTRADLEASQPAILVESPTVGERVTSPLRLRGTANTFEATFVVHVVDAAGTVVKQQVATATSGSGTRGSFDLSVPFSVTRPGGKVVVFENSAENGERIHVVEIPLELQTG
jgi:immunoglobulin-like protein involved in spore germination/sporulation and spore germination protein